MGNVTPGGISAREVRNSDAPNNKSTYYVSLSTAVKLLSFYSRFVFFPTHVPDGAG